MAGIPATSGVGLQRKLLGSWAAGSEVPQNTDEIAYEYGLGQGKASVTSKILKSDERVARASITNKNAALGLMKRRNDIDAALLHKTMSTLKSQNNIATLLGMAGVGLSSLSAYDQMKQQGTRDVATQNLIQANSDLASRLSTYDEMLAGAKKYRRNAGLGGTRRVVEGEY